MEVKQLFADDDAVSPVIGVILMVAITVILAAVIGAFVLDIGGSQESPPQVNWDWSQESSEFDDGTNTANLISATVEHGGGDNADATQLSASLGGTPAYGVTENGGGTDEVELLFDGDTLSTSDTNRVVFATSTSVSSGDTVTYDNGESGKDLAVNGVSDTDIQEVESGDTIEVVWESSDGSQSQVVADYEVS